MEKHEEKHGVIYILANPCLEGWVKIGKTQNLVQRLKTLNSSSSIPFSFWCYATYEVDNYDEIEKCIHNILDELRAKEILKNENVRKREFFAISQERAYGIFKNIATIKGNPENLKLCEPPLEQAQELELEECKTRRSNNSFKSLNINIGEDIGYVTNFL